ncbi:lipocalin-like protein [Hymenobacter chitinivorans DSM 11115]|uniref:Lipocalin-like protein n=2 Tax=Hymenobacter chitinivorans TaxID=89969 RepID=A0A2M9BS57_9BACT|nr:lipocalin-like protein [Hymenobacter chitinivorans DSM 11115]
MKVTKTEMTRYDRGKTPNDNPFTYKYKVDGQKLTCTTAGGHTFTMTVKELSGNRFSWHQDDIDPKSFNYTIDMVMQR